MTALERPERLPRPITLREPRRLERSTHVARGAGLFATLIGAIALSGWVFSLPGWRSLGGEIAMKANTSIAMLLAGVSLLLLDRRGAAPRVAGIVCAAVAVLIGGVTLGQHVFGYDAGIDQVLFQEPAGEPATASPGRMGPPASTGFLLGGIALILLHSHRALRTAQAFASVVVLWSFLAIVGYAYGARELFGAPSTGVALHTAVALFALGLGLIAARFDRGLTAPFVGELGGSVMARRVLPFAVLFPLVVGWLRLYGERTGLFDPGIGTAVFVFLLVVTFAGVIWRSATVINQAQSSVVEAQRHLEMALSAARMGTWSWDVETGKVDWSDDLVEIHGLAPGRFRGTFEAFLDCVHPEDRAPVQAAIAEAVERRTNYEIEFRVPFPDGSTHWVAGYGQVFVDARGNPSRMIGIGRDVTDRRAAAEELSAAYERAQEALRIRDTFLSVAGHEFRTPLSALGLTLHNLSRRVADVNDAGVTKAIRSLQRQAERLEKLTEDLLEVGRIRSGRLVFEPGPVELSRLVGDVVERFRETGAAAGSPIELSVGGPVSGTWDASRLDQVFSNLLANALKFGAGRPIAVEVGCDGCTARVSVRDHGIGIAPADQDRIFDRFERVPSAGTSRGLGLGLWIAREIVAGHGGRIAVASEPGRGSTFTVELPGAEVRA